MLYMTMVLCLLQQRHQLHSLLQKQRLLMPAMEAYARELKQRHEGWNEQLATARPETDPAQIASEALELAIRDLERILPPASPSDDNETLSLDEAIAFIRHRMPPA